MAAVFEIRQRHRGNGSGDQEGENERGREAFSDLFSDQEGENEVRGITASGEE